MGAGVEVAVAEHQVAAGLGLGEGGDRPSHPMSSTIPKSSNTRVEAPPPTVLQLDPM